MLVLPLDISEDETVVIRRVRLKGPPEDTDASMGLGIEFMQFRTFFHYVLCFTFFNDVCGLRNAF